MLCGSHIKILYLLNHTKKKDETKNIRPLVFSFSPIDLAIWCFIFVFHVVCKISNFNKWTAKHLAQASCTELTLIFCANAIATEKLWSITIKTTSLFFSTKTRNHICFLPNNGRKKYHKYVLASCKKFSSTFKASLDNRS